MSTDTERRRAGEAREPGAASTSPRPVATETRRERRRRRRVSYVVLALAAAFFFGPAVAALAGVRATEFENRKLAPFPSLSEGWGALPKMGTWAVDHLPGREQAVGVNNAISADLFGEVPGDTAAAKASGGYAQVIRGKGDWLFLGDDVTERCRSKAVATDQVARMKRLADIVRASGRTFVITIAPDKSSVYPQYLPDDYVGKACAQAATTAFYAALAANPTPGYVDVRTPLVAAAQQQRSTPLYRPRDSHWSGEGITLEVPLVAAALDPDLARGTSFPRAGTYQPIGDLTYLLGAPKADDLPAFSTRREGVTMDPTSDLTLNRDKPTHVTNTTTSAPLYAEPTLLLGDSFTDTSKQFVAPYFKDLTLLHNRSSTRIVADQMAANHTVVIQMGERLAITGNNLLLSDKALAAIAAALEAHPVPK